MIRSLRLLDPSDLFLNFVTEPVRKYLLNRKDTIRKIITSLIDTNNSELHGELRKGGSLEYGANSDDEEGYLYFLIFYFYYLMFFFYVILFHTKL